MSSSQWTDNTVCEAVSGFGLGPLSVLCWPLRGAHHHAVIIRNDVIQTIAHTNMYHKAVGFDYKQHKY